MNQQLPVASKDLTIFVNTSDNFEDCWEPFFKLFKLYWPDCPYPIVLSLWFNHFSGSIYGLMWDWGSGLTGSLTFDSSGLL